MSARFPIRSAEGTVTAHNFRLSNVDVTFGDVDKFWYTRIYKLEVSGQRV